MTNIINFLKKQFYTLIILILLSNIVFIALNFYILLKITSNNISSISSFISSFSNSFNETINDKISYSESIFRDIESKIINQKGEDRAAIKNYLVDKYGKLYHISFISLSGVIFDTTYTQELGFNLFELDDAKETLINARSSGKTFIDFPVLDSSHKQFNLYLLKFLPEKEYYIQLSYKINLLDSLRGNLNRFVDFENLNYYLNMVYIYKQSEYKIFEDIVYKGSTNLKKEIVLDLIRSGKNEFLKSGLFTVELYKLLKYNESQPTNYNLCYYININSLSSKKSMISLLLINIFIFLIYFFLYKTFYNEIKLYIIAPLMKITHHIKTSQPIIEGDINTEIDEFKYLKKSYDEHLENMKVRDFAKRLIEVQENEREMMAREIHDSVIQELSYLLIRLKKIGELQLSDILKEQIQHLRTLISENDISILKLYGLNFFINHIVENFRNKYQDIKFSFDYINSQNVEPELNVSMNIARIIQEIMNNTANHSECSQFTLKISVDLAEIYLESRDNGKGFDTEEAFNKKEHFGLINIRERVYILKGSISLDSSSKGTIYQIHIPNLIS